MFLRNRHPVNNFLPVDTFTWQDIEFPEIEFPITWQQDEVDELLERMQNEIDGLSCPWLVWDPDPLEIDFTECTTLNDLA